MQVDSAYGQHQIYSQKDIKDLVAFANRHGIEVALEIDTCAFLLSTFGPTEQLSRPGHTESLAWSHSELVACSRMDWQKYAVQPPAGQLRIADPRATELITSIYDEVTQLLPGNFFVTGGDEVNRACYIEDQATQALLQTQGRTLDEALQDFTLASHTTISANGKTPVIWEESALELSLAETVVAIAWKGSSTFKKLLNAGRRVIQASSDYFYLDCGMGGWVSPLHHKFVAVANKCTRLV